MKEEDTAAGVVLRASVCVGEVVGRRVGIWGGGGEGVMGGLALKVPHEQALGAREVAAGEGYHGPGAGWAPAGGVLVHCRRTRCRFGCCWSSAVEGWC